VAQQPTPAAPAEANPHIKDVPPVKGAKATEAAKLEYPAAAIPPIPTTAVPVAIPLSFPLLSFICSEKLIP